MAQGRVSVLLGATRTEEHQNYCCKVEVSAQNLCLEQQGDFFASGAGSWLWGGTWLRFLLVQGFLPSLLQRIQAFFVQPCAVALFSKQGGLRGAELQQFEAQMGANL